MTPDDLALLARLAARDATPSAAAVWAGLRASERYRGLLAEEDGAPLGAVAWQWVAPEAEILDLFVVRERRRQGLGARLLDALVAAARAAGGRKIALECRASNLPALALYRRCGFRQVGLRRGYYPGAAGREDALLLDLDLPGDGAFL